MTFTGHSGSQGFAISASGNASAQLQNVTFFNNHGSHEQQQNLMSSRSCSNTTSSSNSSTSSSSSPLLGEDLPACFAPELPSSMVHLQQSSLEVTGRSRFYQNSAGALVVAAGGAGITVSFGRGVGFSNNTAGWLLVADSWQYDEMGRKIITSPQMQLYGPKGVGGSTQGVQEQEGLLGEVKPYSTLEVNRGLPTTVNDSALFSKEPLRAGESVRSYLGVAPKGVAPMVVQMEGVEMSGNAVEGGLLWLRLVNASLVGVAAHENMGGVGPLVENSSSSGMEKSTMGSWGAGVAASQLEGSGSACDPLVYDAFVRVVGPNPFMMER